MKLIICEKPSQAKQVKAAVGDEYIVIGAVGHLLELELSNDKAWDLGKLPIYPKQNSLDGKQIENYNLKENTKKQYLKIKEELDKNPIEVVCGTDPDFEGEVIFRTIIEYYQSQGGNVTNNQKRLILKDTTLEGIKEQMKLLEPIEKYDGWRSRAYGRAYADILLGINATQALTLNAGGAGNLLSVGRVQTPTLKLIVDRYKENKDHKKTFKYAVEFNYEKIVLTNSNQRFDTSDEVKKFITSLNKSYLTNVVATQKEIKPPKLHSLSTLQKTMNKKYKMKASDVLSVLQKLYDGQYTSYPRTDCQVLTEKTANGLKEIIRNKINNINTYLEDNLTFNDNYNKQIVGEVSAHEGITITSKIPDVDKLSTIEMNVYKEILFTCLANFMDTLKVKEEEVSIVVNDIVYNKVIKFNLSKQENKQTFNDLYKVDIKFDESKSYINLYNKNLKYIISDKKIESKPKELFTEGTLLDAMKNAGKNTDSKDIFKDIEGIGTPATRSGIIETLYKRSYIIEEKNKLIPTEKGVELIELLEELNNPLIDIEYTAVLENQLRELEDGGDFDEFIDQIKELVQEIIISANGSTKKLSSLDSSLGECPKCNGQVISIKGKHGKFYGCTSKECNFKINSFYKLTEADVTNMLLGNRSSVKNCTSKAGKNYKAKYYLKDDSIEMEFYNPKKKTKK